MNDTSGPAFPSPMTLCRENGNFVPRQTANDDFDMPGMSLRDYFAAKAMNECMTASADHMDNCSPMSEVFQRAATFSYAYADAMLRARRCE